MNASDENRLLVELGDILEEQIKLAGRGSFAGHKELAGKSEALVAEIETAGLLEKAGHKNHRQRLAKLYRNLQILLSTQKDAVGEQLKSIGRGKKTLAIYRGDL